MKIVDVVTFNGEHELFNLRYNILKDVVDEFIVVEFGETFSGEPKEMHPLSFAPYERVRHLMMNRSAWDIPDYHALADASPNVPTLGPDHWRREFCQKESIKQALIHLDDKDIVFVGDVDEVWRPEFTPGLVGKRIKLRVHTYFLNQRSDEEFWGGVFVRYGDLKDACLNHLRTELPKTEHYWGWHFTSMGGTENLRKKLTDSYTDESYATPQVLDNLVDSVENSRDFLGRDFTYRIDESDWPDYLKANREKYAHLCK